MRLRGGALLALALAQVDAKGKTLPTERHVLLDGGVHTLAGGDVEVGQVVLI